MNPPHISFLFKSSNSTYPLSRHPGCLHTHTPDTHVDSRSLLFALYLNLFDLHYVYVHILLGFAYFLLHLNLRFFTLSSSAHSFVTVLTRTDFQVFKYSLRIVSA
jgi:hypothetical protein